MWMNSTYLTMLANGQLALVAIGEKIPELQKGVLLVATRQIKLGMFHKAVIAITHHEDRKGSTGFIVNKPYIDQHHHPGSLKNPGRTMYAIGGPVSMRSFYSFHNQNRIPKSLQVVNASEESDPVYLFSGELSWAEVVNASMGKGDPSSPKGGLLFPSPKGGDGGDSNRAKGESKGELSADPIDKPNQPSMSTVSAAGEEAGSHTPEFLPMLAIFSGYAGWSRGQLEGEIRRKDWMIVTNCTSTHIFHVFTKWAQEPPLSRQNRRWRDGEKGEALWEKLHTMAQSRDTYPMIDISVQHLPRTLPEKRLGTFEVDQFDTVESIKRRVEEKDGFPVDEQRLVFQGLTLENGRTLMEYGIQKGSVLQLIDKEWALDLAPIGTKPLKRVLEERIGRGLRSDGTPGMAVAVAAAGAGGAVGAAAAAAGEGGTAAVAVVAVAAAVGTGGAVGAVAAAGAAAVVGYAAAIADLGVMAAAIGGAAAATGAAMAATGDAEATIEAYLSRLLWWGL
jgi:putative AlgH/UPF0301 family transcriptional regulator